MVSPSTYFSSQITLIAIFFFCSENFAFTTTAHTSGGSFTKIYAFGDSFTDTGNTRSASGPNGFRHVSNPPYGSTFFHHPTNRYSDGRLVIDFVAETLSLPYLPPYLGHRGKAPHGINFAVAGSTAINHAFFVRNNLLFDMTPQSIQTQMIWFNKFLESQGCRVALIEPLIRKLAIASVTGFLQTLLKKGVKNIVVQGLPPTGCLPLALALAAVDDRDDLGCVKSANNQSYTHTVVYQKTVEDLRKQFPDSVITYLDYWNAYAMVMKNPEKYGFKEPFMACCGSGGPPYIFRCVFNMRLG
ncbi:ZINC FINGER FYVE DOMAIN CONTAINING PROTEIN [Salix koriyanagi]|uniref:ZINC FINGER FYVE DOMAIN CONTAINING PROTEIN n=1 Tax=Salix koriyanagi TaxID=2511006 RepID=A0A9Q1AAF9_9ROSI|nr:ZINC FINGER FYVE DOMAIN CONTAINING PROTEIN [Salix koriyanagi]